MFVTLVQADAPSIRELRPWLWGYLATYTKFGVEPGATGSARLFLTGAAKVIVFNLPDLVQALKPTKQNGLHAIVKGIAAEQAPELLKKVRCWHSTVDTSQGPKLLVLPPASYIAMRPIGKDGCSGMRMPFVSQGRGATEAMQVVAQQDLDSLGASAEVFHTLMSAAAAPTAICPEKKRKAHEPKVSAKEKAKAAAAPPSKKSKK